VKKRKTLGLIINDIDGSYQTLLWLAFKKAANEMDCNLVVFEGRVLREEGYAEKQHHIVYSFVEKGKLDGLIITTSSISANVSYDELKKFCGKYRGIPMVSFGIEIPEAINVISDNKEGMKELVSHLVEEHGYRKIIFVKGPENISKSVDDRFFAYKEVLEKNNINFDEKLVFKGDFVGNTGYRIMEEIIISDMEYDAIVFANDDMALGAMKCIENMKQAGKYPPDKRPIICGFDDSLKAKQVIPRLTTVRQPIKEMCFKSVELLLNGSSEEQVIFFPCAIVKRESCGCNYNQEYEKADNESIDLMARFRAHENLQTYLIEVLFDRLSFVLKGCSIKSCFIFRYVEGPIFYDVEMVFDESFRVPERSELLYVFCDGKRKVIDEDDRIIKTTDILPECFINHDIRYTHLVLPLFFKNEHFGYICFEVTDKNDSITFELLRGQISNTLKGALMLMEREKIEENLRENERLASLGQLIGGISHNLMSPIMSISGLSTALKDLNKEYRESIGDDSVTSEDHYEIVTEMEGWIEKLKEYNSYMSNVISTVKSQTVQLNAHLNNNFTIGELVNRIMFLKNSDITIKKSKFKTFIDADFGIAINGDISNIIQVLDNLIKNAIQSYTDKELHECEVEVSIYKKEDGIMITVKDFGKGIPDEVRSRIFKYIVTTKGREGNGVSLMMSYSTIKGKFGGEIWFVTKENMGTEFFVFLPIEKNLYNK